MTESAQSESRSEPRRDSLAVLRDFDHWFTQLPLRLSGVSRQQFEPLRGKVLESFERVADVTAYELEDLRRLTRQRRQRDEFLVTLDGGTYFAEHDFSFAMTRAVTRLGDAAGGRMIRVAREGFGQFCSQVAMLRREFEHSGATSIVVADDAIYTGGSLAEVVRQLSHQYLEASRIEVLFNPNDVKLIQNVPVHTVCSPTVSLWTHERDLFWGAPTGGVSLIRRTNDNELNGIPYTVSEALLRKRLGLKSERLTELRRELLQVNIEFWSLLSRAAGRPLRLRDSKRLSWAVQLDQSFSDKTLIQDVITWLVDHEPQPECPAYRGSNQ